MLCSFYEQIAGFCIEGEFREKIITLFDPDDATGRTRSVYEDIDQNALAGPRQVLLTLYPEYSKASSVGDNDTGQFVLTHQQALADILKMLDMGYKISSITKD